MAFTSNPSSPVSAEINVTPLIDVLLVLLITFMVLVPVSPRGLETLLPQPARTAMDRSSEAPGVVVDVKSQRNGSPVYTINGQETSPPALAERLGRIFSTRRESVLFVRGDKDLDFASIAIAVASGRAANAGRIGILTPGTSDVR